MIYVFEVPPVKCEFTLQIVLPHNLMLYAARNTFMDALKKTARLVGILYLASGITAAYALVYVSSQIIVLGDADATFEKLPANEFLYRTGIATHVVSEILFMFSVSVYTKYSKKTFENFDF